jgi:hypothetical protein
VNDVQISGQATYINSSTWLACSGGGGGGGGGADFLYSEFCHVLQKALDISHRYVY